METLTLRECMKAASEEVHQQAEDVILPILKNKLMTWDCYKIFVTGHYYIYATLERLLEENKEHQIIAPLYLPELSRVKALETDLEYLYGCNWRDQITRFPAVDKYVSHLNDIQADQIHLLIAHLYVRYLGDLSGGQILKKIFKRMFDLPDEDNGLAFYEFDNISDLRLFKNLYGSRMDGIELTSRERNDVINETVTAFGLNIVYFKFIESYLAKEIERKEEVLESEKSSESYWFWKPIRILTNYVMRK